MADASDSKSDVGDYVWVQVPSPALYISEESWIDGFFDFLFLDEVKKTGVFGTAGLLIFSFTTFMLPYKILYLILKCSYFA